MNQATAILLWGVLTLLLLIIEALTPQLVCIWLAAGSLVALIVAALGGIFWLQLVIWVVASALLLVATWPLSRGFKQRTKESFGARRIIGRHGIVTEDVVPLTGGGQIRVGGQSWSAQSATAEPILAGARVTVVGIEGVRAVVRPSRRQPEPEAAPATETAPEAE